jgi:imidazolonepropionase-like amidohydrolase
MSDLSLSYYTGNSSQVKNSRIELKNGKFIDVINGRYFENVSIVLQNGKIIAIPGLNGNPKDITVDGVIDLQNKTVIPALFNTHSHIQLTLPSLLPSIKDINLIKKYGEKQIEKRMEDCLTHGITNIRDAWTEDLTINRKLKSRILNGEIPGPRIYQSVLVSPSGGTFASKLSVKEKIMFSFGDMPYVEIEKPESGVIAFPPDSRNDVVRDSVNRAIDERGAECIKIYDQREKRFTYKPGASIMTFNHLQVVADQAERRGLKTTMHHLTSESFRRGVDAGISSLAHLPYDSILSEEDVLAFHNSKCFLEPTLSLAYYLCWNIKGDVWFEHPEMVRLSKFRQLNYHSIIKEFWIPELQDSVKTGLERAGNEKFMMFGLMDLSIIFKYYSGIITNGVKNLNMLFGDGKRIACGNDAGAVPCTDAMVKPELEMLNFSINSNKTHKQFNGLEALRMATINSAKSMGLENNFGSIEIGKTADLAVIFGDPLSDFSVIGNPVEALFMDGMIKVNNCGLKIEPKNNGTN